MKVTLLHWMHWVGFQAAERQQAMYLDSLRVVCCNIKVCFAYKTAIARLVR